MKARNRTSLYLKKVIKPRIQNGLYEFIEDGITYQMDYEIFYILKSAFSVNEGDANNTLESWYNGLDRFTKQKVKRLGNYQQEDNGFNPDKEYFDK